MPAYAFPVPGGISLVKAPYILPCVCSALLFLLGICTKPTIYVAPSPASSSWPQLSHTDTQPQ